MDYDEFISDGFQLEVIQGYVKFNEDVIKNLRQQIEALRKSLTFYGMSEQSINNVQFAHLSENK